METKQTTPGPSPSPLADPAMEAYGGLDLLEACWVLARHWILIVLGALGCGIVTLGVTFAVSPVFTARTSLMPPQQQQSSAMAALSSLGGLAGLATSAAGLRSPAEQYVALMQSDVVQDRIVKHFGLKEVYKVDLRVEARDMLRQRTRIAVGKKDGLISVEVDDKDPERSAQIANRYVEELRTMTAKLALTEAQQRRMYFENELNASRDRLARAQAKLQASGFEAGALRAEPKAAAEGFARLQAEVTAAEVRLQALRSSLADNTPEVQRQSATLTSLRSQLGRYAASSRPEASDSYLGNYRDFKYQETLFEIFARQYELARLDESREGPLIQVVDPGVPPEMKSWPRRGRTAVLATVFAGIVLCAFVLQRHRWRERRTDPSVAARIRSIRYGRT